jgi:hypothetical protein
MATPQQNLDSAYPGAADGVAVLDETSGDYWVKNSGIWSNIGPILGETIDIEYDIPPFSQSILTTNILRTSVKVRSFSYSFTLPLQTIAASVSTSIGVSVINRISISGPATVAIQPQTPSRGTGDAYVLTGTASIAVVQFTPEILSSLYIQNPKIVSISAFAPGTQAQIKATMKGVLLIPQLPTVDNVITFPPALVQIQALIPSKIGSFIAPNIVNIAINRFIPEVIISIKTATVLIGAFTPRVQTPVRLTSSVVFQLKANKPDDGSGIIITTTLVNVAGPVPTIDAFPEIYPNAQWGGWTLNWNQVEDSYQVYNSTSQDIDMINILGYQRLSNVSTTTPQNGERSSVVKRQGNYSGRFYLTGPTNNPILQVSDSLINLSDYPWFGSYNPDIFHWSLFSNATYGLFRGKKDWCIEMYVYPLTESFTGTAETASRPLICNALEGTPYIRGWDIHFRGTGTTGTVYARFNDGNYTANPVAVVLTVQSTNNFNANQWNYVAVARIGDQVACNVNGVWGTVVTYTNDLASVFAQNEIQTSVFSGTRWIAHWLGRFRNDGGTGAFTGDSNRFSGYISELRFNKGEIPFTSFTNFSITPSTSPAFPASVHKRTENSVPYYPITSFYEENMWRWFWAVQDTYDATTLEEAVKQTVNRFIIRCKKDGLWKCFTDCYLFIGPRTLNGVIKIGLYGSNPDEWHIANSVSTGFVTGDYNRETGIKGDGVTKWIRTERVNNTFITDNHHRAAWVTEVGTGPIFAGGVNQIGSTYVDWVPGYGGIRHGFVTNQKTISGEDALTSSGGFVGFSRSKTSSYDYIVPGASGTVYQQSQTPWLEPVEILGASIDQTSNYQVVARGSHRIGFYSHGSALDLARLKQRVSQLITEMQAAII